MEPGPRGAGRWLLLLLCLLLIVGQPLSLALIASSLLDAVAARGLPAVLVLLTRVAVTAFGIAAGLALLRGRPAAIAMARISLTASAATDLFVTLTPHFPGNRVPGDEPLHVAVSLG